MKSRLSVLADVFALAGFIQATTVSLAYAAAESADAQPQSPELAEIVVTAQKREQKLNDVGITMAVASADQLQQAGVTDLTQLGSLVPGFTASTSVFGPAVFSLRGVNFNSFQASAPPTVSTYLDEAVLPYPVMGQALFLDVDHVEVLKGPQGTLFGQNATGGSINVIAAKPTRDLSSGVRLDVDNWGESTLEGFVSGPLSEGLGARLAATTTQFGGWQRGYYLNDQSNGKQDKGAARLLLDWQPAERLKVGINLNASYDRSEQQQAQASLIQPAVPAAASPLLLSYNQHLPTNARDADFDLGYDTRADNRNYQEVLRLDGELTDHLTATSLTDYIYNRMRAPHDQDGTAVPNQEATAFSDIHSFNQELRLTGAYADVGVNFVVGASYGKDTTTEGASNNYAGYTGFPPGSPAIWKYDLSQRAAAGFGSVDYEFVRDLTLTLGARYTDTKQTIKGCTFDGGAGGIAGTAGFLASVFNPAAAAAYVPGGCVTIDDTGANPTYFPVYADAQQSESNVSWRTALNYKLNPDTLLYVSVSRGFKAGTFPVIIQLFNSAIKPVKQEELTSYEAGTKLSLFESRLQLNMAAFHYDYLNKQFFSFLPVLGGFLTTATLVNIPKSKVDGFEADVTTSPISGLTLRGGMTYIKTKVDHYVGFDFAGQPEDFTGKEFNYAPPWSANGDAEYRMPLNGSLQGFVGATVTYRARTYADLGEPASFRMPSYTVLDARAGVESSQGWRANVWIRNATDRYYWNSVASSGDGAVRFTGPPRTYGLTLAYRF